MPRRPDGWLTLVADPSGAALDAALQDLVGRLEAARAAAERRAGATALGLREVELVPGQRAYLCAFDGPRFLCVGADGAPVLEGRLVHRVATVSLVWEQLEADVDPQRLGEVSRAAARALALGVDPPAVHDAIALTAERVRVLGEWRDSPLRAIAALSQADVLLTLQERASRAYADFVTVSEPLASRQSELAADLVAALGGFEQAAIAAGLGARLAERLGGMVAAADRAAQEILDAHLIPLDRADAPADR